MGLQEGCNCFSDVQEKLEQRLQKEGLTPDFNKHPKLRDHWDSFVQFKQSEKSQSQTQTNADNAHKKQYFHHLGTGGDKSAVTKWQRMEDDLIARGSPYTLEWPERANNWF